MSSRGTKYWNSGSIPLIAPDLLGDIIAAASDLALVISDEGLILSTLVNPAHRLFGRLDHWEGQNIRDVLTRDSQPKVEARLRAFAEGGDTTGGVELNHSDRVAWDHPVRYSFHRIGPDGAVLMLGRDLRQIAEMQQQLVKAQVALERDYEAQREFDTRYRVLMDSTSEAFVFVSIGSGRIADVNAAAAALLGTSREELASASFAQEFEGRRRGEFTEALTAAALSDTPNPIELVTRRTNERVMVTPRVFRAAGERLILCRVSRESEEGERAVSAISEDLTALYEQGVDAIVFTDREGVIRSANESFLNLADAASAAVVRGRSLGEFFSRGSIDLKVLLENAARAGQMRLYATKLASEYGAEISVEISATYLRDRTHPAFVFVIRDASRVDAVRRPGAAVSDDAVRSVMELVGSATLKEIVAETTDVVEKMCIETAVELTRNNRVAAAEMLGLSRQSLYVKLRKYGLLSRDGD